MQRIAVTDRRAALFGAAIRVIAHHGMSGATTRAIVAEAEMPLASFHYAFASRDAMLTELVESILADQQRAITEALDETDSVRAFIDAAFTAYVDRVIKAPEIELALQELISWGRTATNVVGFPQVISTGYTASVVVLVQAVRDRFGVLWLMPDADIARLVLVFADGVAERWLVDRDDASARRMLQIGTDTVLRMAVGG